MITVDGNLPEQEIRDAMKFHGYKVVDTPEPPKKTEPVEAQPETTSAPADEPGDELPADQTTGKTAAATEEAEETTQEDDTSAPAPAAPKKKAKGGFQSAIDKKTKEIGTLERQLDQERGDKSRLQRQLDEAEAQLQQLRGKETEEATEAEPAALVRPKRPVMPDLADFDFDQDKYREALKTYRTAMDTYDDDMEKFHKEVAEQMTARALEDRSAAEERARVEQANLDFFNAFVARKDKDAEELGDRLEAVLEAERGNPQFWDEHPAIMACIIESDIPGHLMVYFVEHPEEIDRIDAIAAGKLKGTAPALAADRLQTKEITLIENRLKGELKTSKGKPNGEPAPAAKKAEAAPPANTKPKAETPVPPISPVGSRTSAGPKDYRALQQAASDRGDTKEYMRLREEERKFKTAQTRR